MKKLAIALLLAAACGQNTDKLTQLPPMETASDKPAVSVQSLKLSKSLVERSVLATGTTQPVRSADIGPQMAARVKQVLVDEGDVVKLGAPLVRLDVTEVEIRVRQAEASAASTQAQFQLAASEYDRMAPLAKTGTVTAQNLDRLAGQREALKAASDAANIAAENAKKVLSDGLVKAPFGGIISRVPVEVGEVVTMVPPTVLVRLVDLSSVEVRVRVHERDLARIQTGDAVLATFPSTGEKVEGQISFVSPEIDPQTRTAEVVTRIPNEQGTLRSGMFAEIQVKLRDKHDGLVIPRTAVINSAGKELALVVVDGVLAQRKVQTLPIDEQRAEVVDGLEEGDVVVTADLTRLSEGQKVTAGAAPSGGSEKRSSPTPPSSGPSSPP
jgi:membrane fusion protein (multidrug efflux system)